VFSAYTNAYDYDQSFVGLSEGESINQVDTKAFPLEINFTNLQFIASGSAFISADLGFDITFYKKKVYWHFATMGFKELYMRVFTEFAYLYNSIYEDKQYYGIVFDVANELCLDLFVAYGNIGVELIFGHAIGYRVGNIVPDFGLYFDLNIGL
jgi:hypothetical protein